MLSIPEYSASRADGRDVGGGRHGSNATKASLLLAAALSALVATPAAPALAEEEWGLSLTDPETTAGEESDDAEPEGLQAPPTPPEYAEERVEPDPQAPVTLVVIGGAGAVAERFARDLERLFEARLERMAALRPADTDTVLLAGEGGDPEVRLLEARGHAGQGLEQYHSLELEAAVESFHDALHRYSQAMPTRFDPAEMAGAYLMLGATYFVAGNRQDAQEAFRQTLILDPDHDPDRSFFSPPLLEAFDGAGWEVAAVQAGPLTITATPPHAEIWVNGVFRGMAPITLEGLPVGSCYVMARQRGFAPRVESAATSAGEPLDLDIQLRAGPGTTIYASYKQAAIGELPSAGLRMPESIGRLAEMFSADRVVMGRVSSSGSGRTALLRAYDVGVGVQMSEVTFDLLELEGEALIAEADGLLQQASGPAPDPLPEEVVKPPREPFVLPAPADDWRFWAATGAGVAVVAGSVALIAALSGGDGPAPEPNSHWPVIRIPPP